MPADLQQRQHQRVNSWPSGMPAKRTAMSVPTTADGERRRARIGAFAQRPVGQRRDVFEQFAQFARASPRIERGDQFDRLHQLLQVAPAIAS
jgi:hypothetical protein